MVRGKERHRRWVDEHPDVITVDAIAKRLEETFSPLCDGQKGYITEHIAGGAFDMQAQTKNRDTTKADHMSSARHHLVLGKRRRINLHGGTLGERRPA